MIENQYVDFSYSGFKLLMNNLLYDFVLYAFLAFCIVVWCGVALLSLYHSLITLFNVTTNEHVKSGGTDHNPFNQGTAGNCFQVLCEPETLPMDLKSGEEAVYQYLPDGEGGEGGGVRAAALNRPD